MRRSDRVGVGLAVLLIATALCLQGAKPPAVKQATCPCENQSPRRLETTQRSSVSIVTRGQGDTVLYTPRGPAAVTSTLRRCSQHYHPRIENTQPWCSNSSNLVEIHTAYSVDPTCVREDTTCCTQQPVVVLAYQARVLPDTRVDPVLPVVWGPPWAQWSGSTTGPDKPTDRCYGDPPPGACKPPAQWSFAIGCNFTVTRGQLARFTPEPARDLQPVSRLSHDLTFVP